MTPTPWECVFRAPARRKAAGEFELENFLEGEPNCALSRAQFVARPHRASVEITPDAETHVQALYASSCQTGSEANASVLQSAIAQNPYNGTASSEPVRHKRYACRGISSCLSTPEAVRAKLAAVVRAQAPQTTRQPDAAQRRCPAKL